MSQAPLSSPRCRVLLVDDSAVYRSQTKLALSGCDEIEIVGSASNGQMAIDLLKARPVDVMALDLEMPIMNGLETLAEIKRLGLKVNVIVFSSQSKAGADTALQALNVGAADFLAKPILDPSSKETPDQLIRKTLLPKVLQFHRQRSLVHRPVAPTPVSSMRAKNYNLFNPKMLVIASSTGGPTALEKLFSAVRAPLTVPILIVQHMPPIFTASLAERIQRITGIPCAEGVHGEAIVPGRIYIAPGDYHMTVEGSPGACTIGLNQGPQRGSVRPAADHLFESASKIYRSQLLGVVMTGMGADGKDGAVAIKQADGGVIIQSKETCTVWGMPAAVHDAQAFDKMGSPLEIAKFLSELAICKLNQEAA